MTTPPFSKGGSAHKLEHYWQSRYVMLAKVDRKDTETVVSALIKHAHKLPHELYKSLTWDRGKESRTTSASR
jgi:IS30 family transposase